MCREALSARVDGEREPAPAEQVDLHLAECVECAGWYAAMTAASRRLRVRSASPSPDLTAAILGAIDSGNAARGGGPVSELPPRRWYRTVVTVLLGALGLPRRGIDTQSSTADEPVALPAGARYGRRSSHLRAS